MKLPLLSACLLLLFAATIAKAQKKVGGVTPGAVKKNTYNTAESKKYLVSRYDDPTLKNELNTHQQSLKRLSEKRAFAETSTLLTKSISEKQQQFFATNTNYELLFVSSGTLLQQKAGHSF